MIDRNNKRFDPRKVRERALPVSLTESAEFSLPSGESGIPLTIRAAIEGVNLTAWVSSNLEVIEDHLLKYGAVLFRGFSIDHRAEFERVIDQFSLPLMNYMEGATPRTQLGKYVYTSTDYPADQSIALHNELTYARNRPARLWFFCLKPADIGGETPIADVRRVFGRIDPAILQSFIDKGWMLVRNYGVGLSLSWQTVFRTKEKAAVEAYCRASDITCEWVSRDHLRTRQIRPATARHPKTKECVWFNHIAFWHLSSLEASVRETIVADFGEGGAPYNTYYGDGTRIDDSTVERIREAYRSETICFPWQRGDVLMLDNVLVAHGRNPFRGERIILVAMAEGGDSSGVSA